LTTASADTGTSTVTGGAGNDTTVTAATTPVTGGLTQTQKDLITAGNTDANNVSTAADTVVTGGLNQTAATGDTTAATSGTVGTTGAAVAGAGSNILSNLVKKTVANTASGASKNLIKKAAGQKTTAMPSVAKQLTSGALNQLRSSVVPKSVDISKLIPVASTKKTAPLKVNVSKLTPVSNIAGLSTLIKGKG
jgi:hypothetical protein